MIDIIDVRNEIEKRPEHIAVVLEKLGFSHIRDKGGYFTFPNIDGDNMGACCIYKDSLRYQNFTRGESGDLFTLVMDKTKSAFPAAVKYICRACGIEANDGYNGRIIKPFGGFYEGMYKSGKNVVENMKEYDKALLPDAGSLSKKFLDDGIALNVQEEWGVRFSHEDNAILIPVCDYNGRLVGCKARNNDPHCAFDKRWWAYLPYAKTNVVYGWAKNYSMLSKKKTVFVFESEKAVLQCASFNCHIAVAVAGHCISQTQAKYIKSLMADRIVVAFDEGIDRYQLEDACEQLRVDNDITKNKVGYILDSTHEYLAKGSKDSPSDHGRDVFQGLTKNCIVWT